MFNKDKKQEITENTAIPGIELQLRTKKYIFPVLNFELLIDLKAFEKIERINKSLEEFELTQDWNSLQGTVSDVAILAHASLNQRYEGITIEEVKTELTFENFSPILASLINQDSKSDPEDVLDELAEGKNQQQEATIIV